MVNRTRSKPQRGRPPREAETRRNRLVTLVTDAELQQLQKCADIEDKSMSAFIHEILREFLIKQPQQQGGPR